MTEPRQNKKNLGAILFSNRGVIPLIWLAAAIGLHLVSLINLKQHYPSISLQQGFYLACLLLITLPGVTIRAVTVGHSPKGTSGRNTASQVADQLNTSGMYSVCRNPLYLGNVIIWLGIVMLTGNLWFISSFMLFTGLFYHFIIKEEETFLSNKFGESFLKWKEKTPRFLPNLLHYQRSIYQLNWQKILRKEKNGWAAVTAIFFLFKILIPLIADKKPFAESLSQEWPWLALAVFGLAQYLAIKLIVKKTNWLESKTKRV